ncbi:MAG: ComEC/Rec2 family competence protein [Bryobacterales bacterium]|nr:ComEC/Rec2 family competence protein [Bryobacterales bacterium]
MFRRNPVFAPLLAVVAGMLAEWALPGEPGSYGPALALGPLALGLLLTSAFARVRQLLVLAAWFFAGGWWLSMHPLPESPTANVAPGERAEVQGCVVTAGRQQPEQTRFSVELDSGHRMQVSVYPRQGETLPIVGYGDQVTVQARIRPPRNFGNPGSFDFERHMYRQQVFWLASATGAASLRVKPQSCGHTALRWLHDTRTSLLRRIASNYPPEHFVSAYLPAILFGEDQGLSEETLESFRRAGVYHTLVISGQHIAILAAAWLVLLQLLPLPRWLRFLLAAIACWAYALLSGYETPAVRAACGISLYLAGSVAYRRARPVNLLSVVGLVFLAWDPGLLLETGFQLSFAAVLVIAGIAAPLQRNWFGNWPRIARNLDDVASDLRLPPGVAQARIELRLLARTLSLATRIPLRACQMAFSLGTLTLGSGLSLVLVSVVVQAGLSPLLIENFHRAPLLGPIANLVISPLLGLMVPAAFIDLIVNPPLLGSFLSATAELTRQFTVAAANIMPDLRIPNAPGWLLAACGLWTVAGIAACEPLFARPPRIPRPVAEPKLQPSATIRTPRALRLLRLALFLLAWVLWLLLYVAPFPPRLTPGMLEFTAIDVGQGESLLLVTPNGRTILVDAGGLGGFSTSSRLDTGEDIVGPLLWSRGVRQLDRMVLTHYDYDHAGGAFAILRAFRPAALWIPGPPGDHELGQPLLAEAARLGVPAIQKLAGDREVIDGVEFQVLHPRVWQSTSGGANRLSLVIRVRFGASTALLTGDLERRGEWRMIADGVELKSDLLKVAHHGSLTSTTEPFLDAVQPSLAMISAGWLNPFRHPHPAVVERLKRRGVAVWRTDHDGAITFRSDGLQWQRAWLTH